MASSNVSGSAFYYPSNGKKPLDGKALSDGFFRHPTGKKNKLTKK